MRTGRHCGSDAWNTSKILFVRDTRRQSGGYVNVAVGKHGEPPVKALLVIVGWCLLLVLCWPLAILAIVLWPFVWLLSLPLRLVGITVDAVFALLRAILFLPARIFGYRGTPTSRPQ
jgi:hypothetical protein